MDKEERSKSMFLKNIDALREGRDLLKEIEDLSKSLINLACCTLADEDLFIKKGLHVDSMPKHVAKPSMWETNPKLKSAEEDDFSKALYPIIGESEKNAKKAFKTIEGLGKHIIEKLETLKEKSGDWGSDAGHDGMMS